MPTYTFKDTNTGEVTEKVLRISELDQFKADNPHLKTQIQSSGFVSDSKDTLTRAGDGWKDIQNRIKSGMPPRDRHLIKTK
jgi:hypothetical protein